MTTTKKETKEIKKESSGVTVSKLISMMREPHFIKIFDIDNDDDIMKFHTEDVLKNKNNIFDSVLNQEVIKFGISNEYLKIYV